jgi:outer membrane lipoprotein carrier protein
VKFWCLRALNDKFTETELVHMMRCFRVFGVSLLSLLLSTSLLAQTPNADALNNLSLFLKQTQSGRSQFTQVVTSPAKTDQAPRRKTSSGTFEFQRPQQFKFAYLKPFVQTMVSDGQSLWLYDADLNQVTVRKQSQALGQTPAAFIASTGDLKVLQAEFNLLAEPDAEGLQWVKATPKQSEGAVQTIRVGLKVQAQVIPVLSVLEIVDGLGQTSRLSFQNFEVNAKLATETFQFKTPAGAQVIRP